MRHPTAKEWEIYRQQKRDEQANSLCYKLSNEEEKLIAISKENCEDWRRYLEEEYIYHPPKYGMLENELEEEVINNLEEMEGE